MEIRQYGRRIEIGAVVTGPVISTCMTFQLKKKLKSLTVDLQHIVLLSMATGQCGWVYAMEIWIFTCMISPLPGKLRSPPMDKHPILLSTETGQCGLSLKTENGISTCMIFPLKRKLKLPPVDLHPRLLSTVTRQGGQMSAMEIAIFTCTISPFLKKLKSLTVDQYRVFLSTVTKQSGRTLGMKIFTYALFQAENQNQVYPLHPSLHPQPQEALH